MKNWWLGTIIVSQIALMILIRYPISFEQVQTTSLNVWFLRIFSILLLIILGREINYRYGKCVLMIWASLPIVWGIALSSPIRLLIGLFSLEFLWSKGIKKILFIFLFLFAVVFSKRLNLNLINDFDYLNINNASIEVNERFAREEAIKDKIYFPKNLRRLVENKYMMIYKNSISETIKFFDLNTWFFQEFNPISVKGLPIYIWPFIIPFTIGIIWTIRDKRNLFINVSLLVTTSLFIYFLTKGNNSDRMWIVSIPLAIVIAEGFTSIKNKLIKYGIIGLIIYGSVAWRSDLLIRKDYWLDNRPMAYNFWLYELRSRSGVLGISNMLGSAEEYLKYYSLDKYVNTELTDDTKIYAGFVGEIIGSDNNNLVPIDWKEKIEDAGWELIKYKKIRDSIAYKYGDILIIVKKK